MKTYVCDCCGQVIKDPYEQNLKEFYMGYRKTGTIAYRCGMERDIIIDLCGDCYKNMIALLTRCAENRKKSQ